MQFLVRLGSLNFFRLIWWKILYCIFFNDGKCNISGSSMTVIVCCDGNHDIRETESQHLKNQTNQTVNIYKIIITNLKIINDLLLLIDIKS